MASTKPYLLYDELAPYWQGISSTTDYEQIAEIYISLLKRHTCKTVLELGAGGGNNALYMKRHFNMTLTDISVETLQRCQPIGVNI